MNSAHSQIFLFFLCVSLLLSQVKEAPAVEKKPYNVDLLGDQGSAKPRTPEDILSQGGCKVVYTVHENGDEWHPILASHGEQKCITCRCKVSVGLPM